MLSDRTLRSRKANASDLDRSSVEQVEYTSPRSFLEGRGASVTLISPRGKGAQVQGFNHVAQGDRFEVELDVREANSRDFDALLLPGGVANPDQLLTSPSPTAGRRPDVAAADHGPSS